MTLQRKIKAGTAVIGVVGLGYVGAPLALRFCEAGYRVIGFDIDAERVAGFNEGNNPFPHIAQSDVMALRAGGFWATTDYAHLSEVDAILVCVPTPLTKTREPDLRFIIGTMGAAASYLRVGQMLVLESTTWPGTTEEILRPYVDARNLTVGEDFYLVYSPERENPGNQDFSTATIPKIVGGTTPACLSAGLVLYGSIIEQVVPVSSTRAAEMVKLLENIHRSVNIGLVNEMKVVADRMGLDIFEIVEAAATKPFGFSAYYPGPGVGGHCIPIDPFYLTWKAREYGLDTRFIELAGQVNAAMPDYVVDKLLRALNDRGKPMKGSRVLAMGIAYKPDVGDMRESPAVVVMKRLRDLGVDLSYHDPFVPVFPTMREHRFDLSSVPASAADLAGYDAVVLLTDHSGFDYPALLAHASLIIDTRGKLDPAYVHVVRA